MANNNKTANLKAIGFTPGEEKAYLALLKLGPSTTGMIAKESGLSRSKIYETLEKLTKKGVISHFKKNNVSQFAATDFNRINEYLDKKKEEIEVQKIEFNKNIPFFKTLIKENNNSRDAEVFEGTEGIKNIREEALKSMNPGQTIYYFGNPASGHEHMLGYWDNWNERRIKRKIHAQIIYNQDAKEFGERRKKQAHTKIRYLPIKGATPAWIEIYGNMVAITMKYKTPMSIIIRNKYVAESFLTYFKCLWLTSKEKL